MTESQISSLPNCVAESIKSKREQLNLSARSVSLQANLSPSYVSKLESGSIEPSLKAFASIAVVLNFSSAEIIYTVLKEAVSNLTVTPGNDNSHYGT
jgi:transcriptional regulator with XRE-family HTH domain